jgi:hypothetical protein
MLRKLLGVILFSAAFLLSDGAPPVPAADGEQPAVPFDPANLQKGMTQADVLRLMGRQPKQIARQILYRRYLEQWVYDGPTPVRIEFDCVRGKEPQIQTVHLLTAPRP